MGSDRTGRLRRIDLRGRPGNFAGLLPRAAEETVADVRESVARILADVRARGDDAVAEYSARFDGWDGPAEIDAADAARALEDLDDDLRAALERAVEQVRWFHERCRPADWSDERGGARMGVRHEPLERVGVYVPGGLSPLVSTAIMTIVPARVAGVDHVSLATPPGPDGSVTPAILAAAELAGGADRYYRIGGAQAVGALAYGTGTIDACDKIVGPGNAYVAEAKQQVAMAGICGIDLLAGTTEVAIIADDTADPRHVAADLVAQAEHDPLATAIVITPSEALVEQVEAALAEEVAGTRHVDRVRAALDGQGAAVLVDSVAQGVDVANDWAAEHLEIQTADADAVAARVRAAGTIFIGSMTPVSLGDYAAGPNHTLPTAGTARFTGGLTTSDFLNAVNWVAYDEDSLRDLAPVVDALGAAEHLPAHARAARIRLDGRGGSPA
jgi:histidinol dehydrogenase